jgi:hypothetical protein
MNSVKHGFGFGSLARVFAILGFVSLVACNEPTASTAAGGPAAADLTPNVTSAGSNGTGNASGSAPAPISHSDSVTLSWAAPTENTNGIALTNLAGFDIYYGSGASSLTQKISLNSAGLLTCVVSNLSPGTWYFEIVAVNASGVQSGPSSVVSVTI